MPLLTVPQTAERLGIGQTLAWRLVREHKIPYLRIEGSVRVPSDALERWITSRTEGGDVKGPEAAGTQTAPAAVLGGQPNGRPAAPSV